MNEYEQKQEKRRARLERAAARAEAEAQARFSRARSHVDGIPFGQPILVGHHSEKGHRRALERHDRDMRKGCEASDRAEDLARRAAAVGTGGISSDDPDAVVKLDDKVAGLEAERAAMKSANAFYRKHGTLDGWGGSDDLRERGLSTLRVQPFYRVPFPSYSLQNIGARIRQAKARAQIIEQRSELAETQKPTTETIGTATITTDYADNRVALRFPARLPKDQYQQVRQAGFVWSPTRDAFVRKLSTSALWAAQDLARRLASPPGSDPPAG